MYHSNQQRSLKCADCGVISKEVFKAYFDDKNYCIECLIETIKNNILENDSSFKKPDIS
jgi:hypothetical protein